MQTIDSSRLVTLANDRFRPRFHIATPAGWLNDPNGLCHFRGYYHVFYQYNPYSSEWGPMHWGHVRSRDLIHWEQLPVALIPGDPEDAGGCFSGSALVKDGKLYLIYTGHHYYDDGDQEHFWENQNIAISDDGVHFTKYENNPVISAPADSTQHFRDPKVWSYDGTYYVVIGSQGVEDLGGRALLYESADLLNWRSRGPIASAVDPGTEGGIWECPDLFRINGRDILVCSPMGIAAQGRRFLNLNQNGYFVGQLDYERPRFARGEFQELDLGHNFYAPQSFLTPDGRRIQIGWTSAFDQSMPEQVDGWAGMLTFPRELLMDGDHMGSVPVRELRRLRAEQALVASVDLAGSEEPSSLDLVDPTHVELDISVPLNAQDDAVTWEIADQAGPLVSLRFEQSSGELAVFQRGAGSDRYGRIGSVDRLELQVLVDTSIVEIFVNRGAATFTERCYTEVRPSHRLSSCNPLSAEVRAYTLR